MFEHFMLRITLSGSGVVTFKTAAEISSSMMTGLMSEVFKQINPDVIGSDYRDLNVALQYGRRLAANSDNCDLSTVMRLVRNYPSHDFIIGAEEAADLFDDVEEPDDLVYGFLGEIGDIGYNEANPPIVVNYSKLLKGNPASNNAETESEDEEVDKGGSADRTGDPESPRSSPSGDGSDGDYDPKKHTEEDSESSGRRRLRQGSRRKEPETG